DNHKLPIHKPALSWLLFTEIQLLILLILIQIPHISPMLSQLLFLDKKRGTAACSGGAV
ncbi:hypothetical protein M2101_001806, partial [Parabacteroides sp. PM5-20]|nr:hypothetical protein [Parabacteroides sp. PM5-20]